LGGQCLAKLGIKGDAAPGPFHAPTSPTLGAELHALARFGPPAAATDLASCLAADAIRLICLTVESQLGMRSRALTRPTGEKDADRNPGNDYRGHQNALHSALPTHLSLARATGPLVAMNPLRP
jgi:hypothetical protein